MMLSYLSKTPGIGGTLKSKAEDFIVEEIGNDGAVLELDKPFVRTDEDGGQFVHFVLQKKNWSTSSALLEIAKRLHMSQRHFNLAGTKDKTAISTQLASGFGISKEALLSLKIKDIQINGAWMAKDKVRLGRLLGNRFTIRIEDVGSVDDRETSERVKKIYSELHGRFPNYFGEQRFGSTRRNTHLIGQKLLQNDCEGAVRIFLCDVEGEKNNESMEARKELASTNDYARALQYFPKHLRLERTMLAYLEKKKDYVGALKRLPRNILLLFVHAFQSHLFNELLSGRIKESGGELELEKGEYFCGETLGFPDLGKMEAEGWIAGKLIGYGTPLNERELALLEKMGISKDAFRLKLLPEVASKGTYRTLLAPLKDFGFSESVFRFSLPSGCYATMAMREFLDKKD